MNFPSYNNEHVPKEWKKVLKINLQSTIDTYAKSSMWYANNDGTIVSEKQNKKKKIKEKGCDSRHTIFEAFRKQNEAQTKSTHSKS